jgi:hypothetical protein
MFCSFLVYNLRLQAYCNRTATGAGRIRTEQENIGAKITENRSYMRDFLTGQYPSGKL